MFARSRGRWLTTLGLTCEEFEQRRLLAGDITFEDPENYPTGGSPDIAIPGDVNNDQILDLIIGNFRCCGRPSVLLGNGDGTFARPKSIRAQGSAVAAGDFDGDGHLDVAVASALDDLQVMLNKGSSGGEWAGFDRPQRFGFKGQSVASADLDADGDLDLVTGHSDFVRVALNKGISDGQWDGFGEPVEYRRGVSFPFLVATGDLDTDGDVDIVAAGLGATVSVLLGNGDGTFENAVRYKVAQDATQSVVVADFNGDGHLDVAPSLRDTGRIAVLLGNGDGTLADPVEFAVSHSVEGHAAGDLDGDGDLDIVTVPFEGNDLGLLINNGDGTFVEQEGFLFSRGELQSVTAVDMDSDGDLDLAVVDFHGGVKVFLNTTERDVPNAGDANMDGQFNQLDIVQVLQAGKYLTGEPATFGEGDWTGDGVFDQADIVAALAAGDYSPGSQAAATLSKSVDVVLADESLFDHSPK